MKINKQVLDEIKNIAKKVKIENGHHEFSSEEFNFWIVNKLLEQDGRIVKLESTVKILSVVLCGLLIKVVVF